MSEKEDITMDFILCNRKQTLAIYLRYIDGDVPFILKKGSDESAEKIINSAKKRKFFIKNNCRLTKKLFNLDIKDNIPKSTYHKIAEIMVSSNILQEKERKFDTILEKKKQEYKDVHPQKVKRTKHKITKNTFRLDFVNCSKDIEFLTKRIISTKNLDFSMCIYGDSGTGKSAYARYLADSLGIEIVSKSAAELLGQYIGESEKKVQSAFDEAKEKKAMLIIDEVDSFLYSRSMASKSWQISLVNQMLTSMENFNYPFICTTNFIDTLDQASLRRFTFKMKFGFLKQNQIATAYKYVFKKDANNQILNLKGLTVSDLINIKKECDILGIKDDKTISEMLIENVSVKKSEDLNSTVGFDSNCYVHI